MLSTSPPKIALILLTINKIIKDWLRAERKVQLGSIKPNTCKENFSNNLEN